MDRNDIDRAVAALNKAIAELNRTACYDLRSPKFNERIASAQSHYETAGNALGLKLVMLEDAHV